MLEPEELAGRAAAITGGAGGIGWAVAEALMACGARVAVLDRRDTGPPGALAVPCDVTEPESVTTAMAAAHDEHGGLDLLVCCAGVVSEHSLDDLAPAEWQRVVDVSLTGTYLACRAATPLMTSGGAIVALSSGWASRGYPRGAHYAAAKAGVEAFVRSIALEQAARGIRVNAVAPGPVRTDMLDDVPAFDEAQRAAAIPLGRIGEPRDVVGPVLFLLGEESAYVTGQVLHVNGGLHLH